MWANANEVLERIKMIALWSIKWLKLNKVN